MLPPPIKVTDIELSHPLTNIEGLEDYGGLLGLVRLQGAPIGYILAPTVAGCCTASTLSQLILEQHSTTLLYHLLKKALFTGLKLEGMRLEDLLDLPPPKYTGPWPAVTVAICTRDRPDTLTPCLEGLGRLDYPTLDLLIVDNAPSNSDTKNLILEKYPNIRYTCEPRPGLSWARNRAIAEAKGEILAFTDDDAIVDPGWVKAIAQIFAENPEVMAVTGLIAPSELETEAQVLFQQQGGFKDGFEREWHRLPPNQKVPRQYLRAWELGTGANMAYRRCLFEHIGSFNPALGAGTPTHAGEETEMFFRVLKAGYALVYEPKAIVRHRHRRQRAQLRSQLINYNSSNYPYFAIAAETYPEEFFSFLRLGTTGLWSWHLRRLFASLLRPGQLPRDLILAEMWGLLRGLTLLGKARKNQAEIEATFKGGTGNREPGTETRLDLRLDGSEASPTSLKNPQATAVRTVELNQPMAPLTDVTDYAQTRIFVTWKGNPLGSVDISNQYQPLRVMRLQDEIVKALGLKLLELEKNLMAAWESPKAIATKETGFFYENTSLQPTDSVKNRSADAHGGSPVSGPKGKDEGTRKDDRENPIHSSPSDLGLPEHLSVSIVVGTCDRPESLRNCLHCLTAQISPRPVEIIIVDNRPASGLTPPCTAEFPGVILINEPRQGAAYARNAGIIASKGEIIVTIDDDVTMPPDWLEKLIAPLVRPEVMAVTGNILPLELETPAQHLFEDLGGGLGRGFEPFERGGDWFQSFKYQIVPTWEVGVTANAAFRASIFSHPEIGLIAETLGTGTPAGAAEESYLFYKILKAGYTITYQPTAFVWHQHRRELSALRRQLYNYSKGHVAWQLTTLLRDGDLRSLRNLLIGLPWFDLQRILKRLLGQSYRPLWLTLAETAGHLAGPVALWQSHQRVKHLGRSVPSLPPEPGTGKREPGTGIGKNS